MSATSGQKALSASIEFFKTATVDEVPYPCRALADKLDPMILTEWDNIIKTAHNYVSNILTMAGYDEEKAHNITTQLIWRFPTHGFTITAEMAREIGLMVEESTQHVDVWKLMREWLGIYLFERQGKSYIRYVIPNKPMKSVKPKVRKKSKVGRKQKNE